MKYVRLGKTELIVSKPAMGCLPVQRCGEDDAVKLLRAAYERGITFFDTANAYTDSEKKIGLALSDVRDKIVLSTKSAAQDKAGVLAHIENSLRMMKTDYIDLFQFHQVTRVPDPDDPDGAMAGALEAKRRGWFETMQFPFSYISSKRDLALAERCEKADMGYIAMKGLAGGLLGTNTRACHAFMNEYPNVVPIWGIQSMSELDNWIALADEDPVLDDNLRAAIDADRRELTGSFCRSCGYCMPCTVGIEIRQCARMNMLLRRSPWQQYMTEEWREKMNKINDCIECGKCSVRCPYQLDTPKLLKYMLKDYNEFYEAHKDLL